MTSSHRPAAIVEERPDLRPAGVVDEAVDAPEAVDDARRRGASASRADGDVGGERLGLAARLADPRRASGCRRVGAALVVDRDRGALGGGLDRDLGADAAAAARDEDDAHRRAARRWACRGAALGRRSSRAGRPRSAGPRGAGRSPASTRVGVLEAAPADLAERQPHRGEAAARSSPRSGCRRSRRPRPRPGRRCRARRAAAGRRARAGRWRSRSR